MTLLEVLVASGILVIGLVSVAALLPAAGSRLAEATLIDRAGTLSANCYADIWNRGMLTTGLVSSSSRGVFLIEAGVQAAMFSAASPTVSLPLGFQAVTVPDLAFQLPDNVQWVGDELVSNDGRVSAIATVVPLDRATAGNDGGPFRLSIVIFRRTTSTAKVLEVTGDESGVVFQVNNATESDRKRYFPPCGWVLVVPAAAAADDTKPARWLHISSSWSVNGSHFVRFSDLALAQEMIFGKPEGMPLNEVFRDAQVYGFSQLVRVDERSVVLE
jgi:hypothetical protein